jgi:PhnB protein
MDQNRSYSGLVKDILREAEETDRREDELYGAPSRPSLGTSTRWVRPNSGTSEGWPAWRSTAPRLPPRGQPNNPSEDSPDRLGVTSTRIEIFAHDPDGVMNRAIAAGASPRSELQDHRVPWGNHRQGGFRDPFGHNWSVGDRSPLSRQAP